MHKHLEVAIIDMETKFEYFQILQILLPEHLPFSFNSDIDDWFKRWIKNRIIPGRRIRLDEVLDFVKTDRLTLLSYCFGFSLSDHYWLKPKGSQINWSE